MRSLVGLLLVAAAVLKAVQLITEPAAALVDPLGRGLLPVQIGTELALGLLVLSGLYWHKLRWLVLVLFTGFAGYSLYLAVTGATSCGCFGPIRIHPWWMLGLDLAVVAGLLFSTLVGHGEIDPHPTGRFLMRDAPHRHRRLIVVGATVATIIAALLFRYTDQRTAVGEGLVSAGDLVVLEPEHWIGKRLPIAGAIDLDLSQGEWTILLHRHDCPVCQEQVPHYEQRAAMGERVALVEVPPYGDFERHGNDCSYARLQGAHDWFVQTPVELRLKDGVVQAVKTHEH